jgi:hypothetical protein
MSLLVLAFVTVAVAPTPPPPTQFVRYVADDGSVAITETIEAGPPHLRATAKQLDVDSLPALADTAQTRIALPKIDEAATRLERLRKGFRFEVPSNSPLRGLPWPLVLALVALAIAVGSSFALGGNRRPLRRLFVVASALLLGTSGYLLLRTSGQAILGKEASSPVEVVNSARKAADAMTTSQQDRVRAIEALERP